MPDRIRGIISKATGPENAWGFINHDGGSIFFLAKQCVRDFIGIRNWSVGTPVEFEIADDPKQSGRIMACNIVSLDPETERIDLSTYQENSIVITLLNNGRRGYLQRCSNDQIGFQIESVITEGTLEAGTTWVRHKIGRLEANDHVSFFAYDLEIYEVPPEPESESEPAYEPGSAEAFFEAAPELPLAPVEGQIYSDSDRKKSIRQLISEGRSAR